MDVYMYIYGEGNGTPLQYSCLENPMDGGDWKSAVHGVVEESDTTEWLHFHFSLSCTGEGNGNPLQHSCLKNRRGGGAWWAADYGVAQSRTWLKWLSSSSSICISEVIDISTGNLDSSLSFFQSSVSHEVGGQSTGASALASFLPKKSQGWSPSEWTGWISLQSKGLSRVFFNTTVQKHQFFGAQPSSQSNSHIHTYHLHIWGYWYFSWQSWF